MMSERKTLYCQAQPTVCYSWLRLGLFQVFLYHWVLFLIFSIISSSLVSFQVLPSSSIPLLFLNFPYSSITNCGMWQRLNLVLEFRMLNDPPLLLICTASLTCMLKAALCWLITLNMKLGVFQMY